MEIILMVIGVLLIWALYELYVINKKVQTALSYTYLEDMVDDAVDSWVAARLDKGTSMAAVLNELEAANLTDDILLIAWKYPTGSFEDRVREATKDLLDAWFPEYGISTKDTLCKKR